MESKASLRITSIAIVTVLLGSLPSVSAVAGTSTSVSDEASVQAMLGERSKAVSMKDRQGFMNTVDSSQSDFAQSQSRWFDGITALPITGYSLHLQLDRAPELTRDKQRRAYKTKVLVADVEERFTITGYDQEPTNNDLILTFVKRGASWKVASDSDTEDLGILTNRSLWEFGQVQTRQSQHFMLLFHPDQAKFAADLLDKAEAALPDVAKAWNRQWSQKVPVIVPSSDEELKRLLGATFDVSNFVAFATASLELDAADSPWKLVGRRIFLNRSNFISHSASSRRSIFAHELTHVAARSASGPFIPTWVEEGLAQLSEGATTDLFVSQVKAGRFSGQLPEDWQFTTGTGTSIFLSYQASLSAMRYMRSRFGEEAPDRLYAELGGPKFDVGTQTFHVDLAMQKTFAESFDQFQSDWAADVKKQAGVSG
ncbi:MAG: hypothetical protein LC723_09600 [Actinobacteria bacterium]|nr:hypothetical protein [Actinomycetota bacterium]